MSQGASESWVAISAASNTTSMSAVSVFGPFETKERCEEWIAGRDGMHYMPKVINKGESSRGDLNHKATERC